MTVIVRRINIKTRGFKKLMKGEPMVLDMTARGVRVVAAVESAGIRVEGKPGRIDLPVALRVSKKGRARARVVLDHPAGKAVEAKHGILAASIDAAG
jgi:hypothetical protein